MVQTFRQRLIASCLLKGIPEIGFGTHTWDRKDCALKIRLDADIGSRLSTVPNGKLCGTFRCTVFKNLQTLQKKKGYEVSVASMLFTVIKTITKGNVTVTAITTDSPRTGSGGNVCLN